MIGTGLATSITGAAQAGQDIVHGGDYLDNVLGIFHITPQGVFGIDSFVFDIEGEDILDMDSDITDHWLENNKAVQDNIGFRPVMITLRGYIGEAVLKKPGGVLGALNAIQNKLTAIPAYIGRYTPTQIGKIQASITKATQVVNQIDLTLQKIKNVVAFFPGATPQKSKQEQALAKLRSLRDAKVPFWVKTPWGPFPNMVIKNLRALQNEDTKIVSDISVTLKQLQFVQSPVKNIAKSSGRRAQMAQPKAEGGNTNGTPQDSSAFFKAFKALGFLK